MVAVIGQSVKNSKVFHGTESWLQASFIRFHISLTDYEPTSKRKLKYRKNRWSDVTVEKYVIKSSESQCIKYIDKLHFKYLIFSTTIKDRCFFMAAMLNKSRGEGALLPQHCGVDWVWWLSIMESSFFSDLWPLLTPLPTPLNSDQWFFHHVDCLLILEASLALMPTHPTHTNIAVSITAVNMATWVSGITFLTLVVNSLLYCYTFFCIPSAVMPDLLAH